MPRSSTITDRVARTLALLLAIAAVAGVTTAWVVQHHTDQRRASVGGQVPQALGGSSAAPAAAGAATPSVLAVPTSTPPASPTASPAVHPIVPAHLYVPAIGVNTKVTPKPTEMANDPFVGKVVPSFGVPDDMYTTTWWSSGPKPGAAGMAVILGHTQIGGYGVFNRLGTLRPGQQIGVSRSGRTLRFAVLAVRTGISKKDPAALSNVLAHHPAAARLALLTCSGDFNRGYRESAENTVVFATLVSAD